MTASVHFRTCDVRVDAVPIEDAYERLRRHAHARTPATFHFVNAYTLSLTQEQPAYAGVFAAAELNLPDGMPLAWLGSRLCDGSVSRVSGSEFFAHAMDQGRDDGLRHYLYGSSEAVLAELSKRIENQYPGALLVGAHSPPFRSLTRQDQEELKDELKAVDANVLWVALGTPKQDFFCHEVAPLVQMPVLAVGAAFDFLAGAKKRAPEAIQRVGLEWLHRLASEPRRLGKRYLLGNARFLRGVAQGVAVEHFPHLDDDGPDAERD